MFVCMCVFMDMCVCVCNPVFIGTLNTAVRPRNVKCSVVSQIKLKLICMFDKKLHLLHRIPDNTHTHRNAQIHAHINVYI